MERRGERDAWERVIVKGTMNEKEGKGESKREETDLRKNI